MVIGILGAGQLGRMLAQAGAPLGMAFRFLDPAGDISARGLGEHIAAPFEDIDALSAFARGLDAITYEFENVPVESVRWLAERVPTHPSPDCLRVAQDRLFEKSFFREQGIAVPPFASFFYRDEYDAALAQIGFPAVLKTRRFGYDGKGQRVVRDAAEAEAAWKDLRGMPLFLEGFVPFRRELSIIAARTTSGDCAFYPLAENTHRGGILRRTIAPAPDVPPALQAAAESIARRALEAMGYVGVLAVELFEKDGALLANEMAPRVHNSGHWTIEGAATGQFENHLRAIAGLPLGPTDPCGEFAMFNIIGSFPDLSAFDGRAEAAVHLYGKAARPGRKLGHVTVRRGAADLCAIAEKFSLL